MQNEGPLHSQGVEDDAEGTDFHATAHGHVAVTPLKVDLTDHENLRYWAQTAARMVEPDEKADLP